MQECELYLNGIKYNEISARCFYRRRAILNQLNIGLCSQNFIISAEKHETAL